MKVKSTVLRYLSTRSESFYGFFLKSLTSIKLDTCTCDGERINADILQEHNLSTPHFPYCRFIDYVIMADKNIFLKRLQENVMQTMRKIWISSRIFTLNDRSGPNTYNTYCRISLILLREREHLGFADCAVKRTKGNWYCSWLSVFF